MVKKQLLAMKQLFATETMVRMVKEDKGTPYKRSWSYGYSEEYQLYDRYLFFDAVVQDEILKVAAFTRKHIACGKIAPQFEIYISKSEGKWTTYADGRWLSAKIDNLNYDLDVGWHHGNHPWQSERAKKVVNDYFGTDSLPIRVAVLDWQNDMRKEEVKKKARSITDRIDSIMENVPELPKDFDNWVVRSAFAPNKCLFYKYGTNPFCSPEHFGFDTVSAATDIYSIGKLIHHLLPYISDGVPSLFSPLICECIKVDKGQRIQNIQLFLKKFTFVCRQHTNSSFKRTIIKGNYKPLTGGYALTEDMLNELTSIHDLVDFIHKYEKSFEKCDVVDYFERILKNKGLKKSEVIQQADIERTYGYQLLNGTKKPSRDKLIQLCMGAKLKVEETQMALKRTGFAPLYPKNKRDCIIIYAIKSGKSVSETDALLDKFGVELLNEE